MAYTKLDSQLIHSTVWRETNTTRIVWITMLAMKDRHGEVLASIPGLADAARVTLAECEAALAKFLAPDKYSRTQANEGRRIEAIDGGWYVINHDLYRAKEDGDDKRLKAAARAKRYRERKERDERDASVTQRDERDVSVTSVTRHKISRQADADADADTNNLTTLGTSAFDALWSIYPKRAGSNPKEAAAKALSARLKAGTAVEAIRDGLKRYSAFCEATGAIGTEFVMQTKRFFGPGEEWAQPWTVPKSGRSTKPGGKLDWAAAAKQAEEDDRG